MFASVASILRTRARLANHIRHKISKASFPCMKRYFVTSGASENSENSEKNMIIGFNCNVCSKRNYKMMSKHAYTNGLVIIKCDGCTKLHLISDRIGWFTDKSANNDGVDVERLLREKGESVAKQVNGHEEEHAIKQLLEQHKKK